MTRPGPKPGPPGSQRTARLVVRVTPAELSAYQAAAGRAGVSMGELVRQRMAPEPAPWVPFDGTAHPLPPQRRLVLVRMSTDPAYSRGAVVVGYMKFAAGDKSCPYFVTPSAAHGDAIAWCDCLPEAMQAMGPHWPWELPAAAEKEHGG